jgi:hypothetical protein
MKLYLKKTLLRAGGQPYLIRYTLFKCKKFSIKLHHVLISDVDVLHDHPWDYTSIILKGGYWEHHLAHDLDNNPITQRKWYRPGSILRRKGYIPHRLELPNNKTCWSLIFTSYRKRDWGFLTKEGWESHKTAYEKYE